MTGPAENQAIAEQLRELAGLLQELTTPIRTIRLAEPRGPRP